MRKSSDVTLKAAAEFLAALSPEFVAMRRSGPTLLVVGYSDEVWTCCEVEAPGPALDVVVEGARILPALALDGATVAADDLRVTVTAGRTRVALYRTRRDVPAPPLPTVTTFPAVPILAACRAVVGVASRSDEVIGSVCVDGIHAVATDGHRMAAAVHGVVVDEPFLLPRAGLGALLRAVKTCQESATLSIGTGWAAYRDGSTTVALRLAGGKYPPWQQVLPRRGRAGFEVARATLSDVFSRACVIDTKRGTDVDLTPGEAAFETKGQDGTHVEALSVGWTCAPLALRVSPHFVVEALARAADTVRVEFGTPAEPVAFWSGSDVHVVMPMRREP